MLLELQCRGLARDRAVPLRLLKHDAWLRLLLRKLLWELLRRVLLLMLLRMLWWVLL
jgi:hypothetical protein